MEPNDPLEPILNRWEAPAPPPGSIRQEMWRRIARDERTERVNRSVWRFGGGFAQPAFAAVFVVCCMLAGLFAAEVRVSQERHQRQVALAKHYLAVIDPLAADRGGGSR